MPQEHTIDKKLPAPVAARLKALAPKERTALREIRLRLKRPAELVLDGSTRMLDYVPEKKDMDELLAALSGYALYSCEAQLAQGYITIQGGHRAGVCGRMAIGADGSLRMAEVTSVCIRIARLIPGAGEGVYPHLLAPGARARRVLMLGPPGCGKTTVLKDCVLYLSEYAGMHVAVADEREEMGAVLDAGKRVDVLSGVRKAQAFSMLIRTMAPQALACDEIGRMEDVDAVLDAVRCGAGVLATAHADGFDDAMARPAIRRLLDARAFERYVLLGACGSVRGVWNERGEWLFLKEDADRGDVGRGGDGNDSGKCNRLLAL